MFINGKWEKAEDNAQFEVFNPATGEMITRVADAGPRDISRAIDAADQAFPAWSALTAFQRSQYLYLAWQLMMEKKEDLARIMTMEQGKPLKAARNEVQYGADFLLWFAEEAKRVYGQTIPSARPDQRFMVLKQPIGVVGAVTPWNYPVSMITRKLAPALAAGCTAVLKPAEATPLCAVEMFKIFEQAGIPAGVVNLLTKLDPKPVGQAFVSDPRVKKLTFTGSTQVGKFLGREAAGHMKRISLELGGHAPFILFDDADPVHAAKGAVLVKFLNTGQACISPNRIFVPRSMVEDFTREFVQRVKAMKAGNGMDDGVRIGPLVGADALAKVENQVKDALDKGARLLAGGERLTQDRLERGWFYAPTVLTGVTPDMLIYREETFGPVAPVIAYGPEEDVVEMANDTVYGLAAYVYTKSISRAMSAFERLHFGIIGINDINPTSASAPFGGMKESGMGREGAREGIEEYLETKLGGFSI
ncbi:NAD-dependent succinate-semialdehyde dehydrogenase [Desulfospira joergensenii]|uniref:NAD-dependent succinate-semialdehyde dehydrogenase n=1 Tax=Desulfospira joergensenii TaxID=53329 RepID=UPI0003B30590|nr:NAD-dependent succinate-semialdehyde dehydrogenase [Desulfospira joergensenii]